MTKPNGNNRLSVKESIALVRWLEANLDSLHRVPRPDIARRAQAALGFNVTPANIAGACEAGDIKIEPALTMLTSESNGKSYFLAHAVIDLYEQLGAPVPKYLRDITHGHALADITASFNDHRAKRG